MSHSSISMHNNDSPSAASSSNRDPAGEVTRESILQMIKNRTSIDDQINALGGILESNHIGMKEPLTDAEGFPRNDIDVFQVRHARYKIICLQNDRKNLTKEIEAKLLIFHSQAKEKGLTEIPINVNSSDTTASTTLTPIAKVNIVSEGSPAFQAGIHVDDEIISVGSINSQNFTTLTDIGNLVQACKGTVVSVTVRRRGISVKLALIPGPWAGKGLIGCNILPI